MAVADNAYSRFIWILKVALPLLAIAGLSSLFLVARPIDPAQNIPYADVDIDALTSEQSIGRPTFAGVAENGATYTVTAERAWPSPDDPELVEGEKIFAEIDLPNGTGLDLEAGGVTLASATQEAGLISGVEIKTTDGYALSAKSLVIGFDTMHFASLEPIYASGPNLNLEAGSFELTGNGTDASPYRLVFKDTVKLLYHGE